MNQSELKALISLLDDTDNEVLIHVENKLLSLGESIIPYLEEEWENNLNPNIQKRIEELIHVVQFDVLKNKLVEWKNSKEQDLLEGMWLIATYHYPDLELSELKQTLEQIYYEVWLEMKNDPNPYDQIKMINSVLFGKLRFGPNSKNFHSPSNSMINIVLQTRKGNPISLCAIYMMVAQKLKLPIYGVNLPNLFVLTYINNDTQFYVNAFNRGLIFSKNDIENYVLQLNLQPLDQFFEPCNNFDIITRMLRNLIVSFEKLGEKEKVADIRSLMEAMEIN